MKFIDFMLNPKNIAEVSNFVKTMSGVNGASKFIDSKLLESHEFNPPGDLTAHFVELYDEEHQKLYDAIWNNYRKKIKK